MAMPFTRQRAFRVDVAPITAFALSNDGARLAAFDEHGVLRVWAVQSGALELDPDHRWARIHTHARPRSGGAWGLWAVWPSDRPNELRSYYQIDLPPPLVVGQTS